jgi:AraC-like DNA-binding protein/ligand-binding sensor protein
MKQTLEIILESELREMLDHFAACFGVRIAFFSPDGEEILVGKQQPICPFCAVLRGRLGLAPRCLDQDRRKLKEASLSRKLVSYACHAGLVEAVQPVFADSTRHELAGFIMIGQFRTGTAYSSSVAAAAAGFKAKAELDRLFADVQFIPPAKLKPMLGLLTLLVNSVADRHLVSLHGDLMLNRVERFIHDNRHRPVTLAEAAKIVHRSPSTISHLFQRRLGKSFKQVVVEAKLAAAEEQLRTVPGTTVSEAAAAIGYPSPFHFSRIFKKHRGYSPASVRQPAPSPGKAKTTVRKPKPLL